MDIDMESIREIDDDNGTVYYYNKENQFHRTDGPAVEYADGRKQWRINDKLHRENGPAVEYPGGSKWWYINDKRHREDGPAIERFDGSKYWYFNDKEVDDKDTHLFTGKPEDIVILRLKYGY